MGGGSQVLNEVRLSGSKANSLHCCYCQLRICLLHWTTNLVVCQEIAITREYATVRLCHILAYMYSVCVCTCNKYTINCMHKLHINKCYFYQSSMHVRVLMKCVTD